MVQAESPIPIVDTPREDKERKTQRVPLATDLAISATFSSGKPLSAAAPATL